MPLRNLHTSLDASPALCCKLCWELAHYLDEKLLEAERKATAECRFKLQRELSRNFEGRNLYVVGTARGPCHMIIVELPLILAVQDNR